MSADRDAPPVKRIWQEPDDRRSIQSTVPEADPGDPRRAQKAAEPRPIVDAFCSVGPYRTRQPGTPYEFDDLVAEHERLGIGGRICLHAEARDGVPDEGNFALTRLTILRQDTGLIWTALPPRRFAGTPIERWLGDAQAAGVAMVALFPETHGHHLAPWANRELYSALEASRLPLVLDVRQAPYAQVHEIAVAHPRLRIILWNAFYMDERMQVPLLDACPNVHVGIATVFIPTWGIEQFTARYGPGRLIFGSNWPAQSPGPLLTYVRYAAIPEDAKQAILGETVRRLAAEVAWPVRGFAEPPP